jgi:2-phospho-L-lactate transferase/gluconeogenesis factor (CofD/UPF0052 family)
MTQMGETDGFSASDHLKVLEEYLGKDVLSHMVLNNGTAPDMLLDKYKKEHQKMIIPDIESTRKLRVIKENFIKGSQLVRHNSEKLAKIIMKI